MRAVSQDKELVHGKRYTYVRYHCRCQLCKEANAEYKRNKTAYYKSLTSSKGLKVGVSFIQSPLPQLTHGLPSTYEWYGCRCEACTEAVRESWRQSKALNAELRDWETWSVIVT